MVDRTALVTEINESFPNQPIPYKVDDQIREWDPHPEVCEARSLFLGKCWKEIPDSTLLENCPSPFLIGHLAFRYFLPAFLLAAIRDEDQLMEGMIETLKPPRKEGTLKDFNCRFKGLTARQSNVVVLFLEYVRDVCYYDDDRSIKRINNSINRYWAGSPTGK